MEWFNKVALVRTHKLPKITTEHFQNQNKGGGKKESGREKATFLRNK